MVSIFTFTSYRNYLQAWLEAPGTRAHGAKGRIAVALGVSPTLISLIFKGEKTLTPEQTSELAEFLGLSEMESDYLHLLVDHDRAGTHRYREKLGRKITAAQDKARTIGTRVPRDKELSEEQKATYYSSWMYTGIRNLTAVKGYDGIEAIAEHLELDATTVQRVMRFLLENGLCKEVKGKISYGPAAIHIDKASPFVTQHHRNWRMQGMRTMEARRDQDLFFTGPMSLSRTAAAEIRTLLPTVIQSVMKISGPSDSEVVHCLNIDWFEY